MPGVELVPRLYLRHTLVDGVATAQHFAFWEILLYACCMDVLCLCCKAHVGSAQAWCAIGYGADYDRRPGEGSYVSVFGDGGMSNKGILEEAQTTLRELLTLWARV